MVLACLLVSCLLGCASSSRSGEKAPPAEASTSSSSGLVIEPSEYLTVTIVPEKGTFAAYTVELKFDPYIVSVDSVEPGDFPANPVFDLNLCKTGKMILVGFSVDTDLKPGELSIAKIRFIPCHKGSTPISASIISLYGGDSNPVSGTVKLSAESFIVK